MFITHQTSKYSYFDSVCLALEGGIRLIQLRIKDVRQAEVIEVAKKAKIQCDKYNATLLVDDYVNIVEQLKLDGVHLGKKDLSVAEARTMLENKAIIGATANTVNDILNAVKQGVDYIGLGPYSYTTTKRKLENILGIESYRKINSHVRNLGITVPIYAIGGITCKDVKPLLHSGVYGVAVSSAILQDSNPLSVIKNFLLLLSQK